MWCSIRKSVFSACALAYAVSTSAIAAYPDQPIKIVIGNAPGGGVDIMARLLASLLAPKLQTAVIVDNKPGAGGIIGADFVAKAKPDGYTMLVANSGLLVQPLVHVKMPYDTMRDLVGLASIARGQAVLVASPTLKFSSGKEFVELLRANPGKYNYASLDAYTEVTTALFNKRQEVDEVKVPYRSVSQMMPDIWTGASHYALASIPAAKPFIDSGKLRAIGVASPRRNEDLPNVPTFREAGLADMEIWTSYGIFLPRGVPAAVVKRLHQAVAELMKDPEYLKSLKNLTLETWETTMDQFQREMADQFVLFQRAGAEAGIKPD